MSDFLFLLVVLRETEEVKAGLRTDREGVKGKGRDRQRGLNILFYIMETKNIHKRNVYWTLVADYSR